MNTNYSPAELLQLGFASIGQHVFVDRTARFFGAENIRIGDHTRIDAYCVLSAGTGGILIGSYVHLSVSVSIVGAGSVVIEDFAGLSAKVSVFSSNDDYTGGAMTNPTVPREFRNATDAPVMIRRHAVVGAGSVILPGIEIGTGAAIGALTVVRKSVGDFVVVAGNPARQVAERGRAMLEHEEKIRAAFRR